MLNSTNRLNIQYTPNQVGVENIVAGLNTSIQSTSTGYDYNNDTAIADKLIDHLNCIKDYHNRLDALDYLIDQANQMAGNLTYEVGNDKVLQAMQELGHDTNMLDFKIFSQAVDIVIDSYGTMATMSLTGADMELYK